MQNMFKIYKVNETEHPSNIPFKNRSEFTILLDIFNRKICHHLILDVVFDPLVMIPYLKALLLYLNSHEHFSTVYHSELIYFSEQSLFKSEDLIELLKQLENTSSKQICFFENIDTLSTNSVLAQAFNVLSKHPNCRLITTLHQRRTNNYPADFVLFQPSILTLQDLMALLENHAHELEKFHQVTIPEPILAHTFYLAKRYLPPDNILKNALLLLDSAAARQTNHDKTVNHAALNNVISAITQIPTTHLQKLQFNLKEFMHSMQMDVIGQDDALSSLGKYIQQSFASLQIKNGPILSLLFAGCQYVGKNTAALALVNYLFQQNNVLIKAKKSFTAENSLVELKFFHHGDHHAYPLHSILSKMPYALIFIEDVDQLSESLQRDLHEILSTGYLLTDDCEYDFHQTIIILTTTYGSLSLAKFHQSNLYPPKENEPIDLIGFVENERKQHFLPSIDTQEMSHEILTKFSFSRFTHIIPFLPLSKTALEKIMFKKLKSVSEQLKTQHNIELGYAPEVIRYLTEEAILQQNPDNGEINVDEIFKIIYHSIEKAIFNRSNQKTFFLQLNETGEILRCA